MYQKHLNQFSKEESIKATFSKMKNETELMIIYKKILPLREKYNLLKSAWVKEKTKS